jgi:hypothetical protein
MIWEKIRYDLGKNPVWFGEKIGIVGKSDFVAFRMNPRLQSLIIIIFRTSSCVWTVEQSRTIEETRPDFGKKSGMIWRKIRYGARAWGRLGHDSMASAAAIFDGWEH